MGFYYSQFFMHREKKKRRKKEKGSKEREEGKQGRRGKRKENEKFFSPNHLITGGKERGEGRGMKMKNISPFQPTLPKRKSDRGKEEKRTMKGRGKNKEKSTNTTKLRERMRPWLKK